MPRRITDARIAADAVPSELRDESNAAWSSADATIAWLRDHGIDTSVPQVYRNWDEVSPKNRFAEAIKRWALTNGLMRSNTKGFVDLNALGALGITLPTGRSLDRVRHLTEMGLWGRHRA